MKITFLGAAREVTGSCYLLEVDGKNLLVDCGMEQGPNIYDNQQLPIDASKIDAVVLTHAHIDHSGLFPLLTKRGFCGKFYMAKATSDLCKIMLLDSAKIQEFEAEWRSRKQKRGGNDDYEPLYDTIDVNNTIKLFFECDYDVPVHILENIKIRFVDAGHLLGSSGVEFVISEKGESPKTLVFSGDIGNKNKPIIRNPSYFSHADYAIMESTYGDRNAPHVADYTQELANIIERTMKRKGNVVIPSFAVGRMQEILFAIRKIKEQKLVNCNPDFPVYVDSPLSVEATSVYKKNLLNCYDEETKALVKQGINPIGFTNLYMSVTTDESKAINANDVPKVILSASGMCEAGRIRHHLKHNLWRSESCVVFVGYQVAGTLGRSLLDGAKSVKLFGDKINVNAEIVQLPGTSSHADVDGLMEWASKLSPNPKHIFVTHGEDAVTEIFAKKLCDEQGQIATAPYNGEVWDLTNNVLLVQGNQNRLKPVSDKKKAPSPIFDKLMNMYTKLGELVKTSQDGTNENMRQITAEIERILKDFD